MAYLAGFSTQRHELKFSIDGLSAREELLFKNLVRLLSFKTEQSWLYSANSPHLRVQADSYKAPPGISTPSAQQVLILGMTPAQQPGFLCLPVRAHELEAELNRVGALISRAALSAKPSQTTQSPGFLGQTLISAEPTYDTAQKLRQWPSPKLLAQAGRIRLATLLTSRALTLVQLQQVSGHPLVDCKSFWRELEQARLFTTASVVTHVSPAALAAAAAAIKSKSANKPPELGLLARIRLRLGLQIMGISG